MAEIEMNKNHKHSGVKKMQKKNTRVDLTPMVDLGFLLLTFFVFTTALSQPNVLGLKVPKPENETAVCNSCALTLVPAGDNQIFYYEGSADNEPKIGITSFSVDGVRKLILEKKKMVLAFNDPKKELVIVIKPGDDSNYQNFVNILDEISINDVPHYFVARQDIKDKLLLPGIWK